MEPDLEEEDGTPRGSHAICAQCEREFEVVENALLETPREKMDALVAAGQLELDLGA